MFEIPHGEFECRRTAAVSELPDAAIEYEVQLGLMPGQTLRNVSVIFDSSGNLLEVMELRSKSESIQEVTVESFTVLFKPDGSATSVRIRNVIDPTTAVPLSVSDVKPMLNDVTTEELAAAGKFATWLWQRDCGQKDADVRATTDTGT